MSYDQAAMATGSCDASRGRWRRRLVLALTVQAMALYWPFSVTLPLSLPGSGADMPTDKLVHVVLFAVPAYCAVRLAQVTGRVSIAVVALVALIAHAGLSEQLQGAFLPRQRDPVDVLADLCGVLIGAVWAYYLRDRILILRGHP